MAIRWSTEEKARQIRTLIAGQHSTVTSEQVISWFKETNPTRKRRVELTAKDVEPLVRIINELHVRARNPAQDEGGDIEKLRRLQMTTHDVRKLQTALRELQSELPWLFDAYRREEGPDSPAVRCLSELKKAIERALPYIGERYVWPKLWHTWAEALAYPIERALKATGHNKPSRTKSGGPLVRILCHALEAIDGQRRDSDAVASALKRRRRKVKAGSSDLR